MTTLNELLESLSYVELSDMSGGGEADGTVSQAWRNRVISILNSGLSNLYTEFSLRTKEETADLYGDPSEYTINSSDFIRIDKISLNKEPIFINDTDLQDRRITLTSWKSFSASGFADGTQLVITYRASPDRLSKTTPGTYVLPVPFRFDELLRAYVAWQIYFGSKDQVIIAKSQQAEARYMTLLQDLKEKNISNEFSLEVPGRWFDKGWGLTPTNAKDKNSFINEVYP